MSARHVHRAPRALKRAGFALVGLDAHGERSLFELEPRHRLAMIVGGETTGVSPAARELLDETLRIPMAGGVSSLNVSAAAALATYECTRARRGDS